MESLIDRLLDNSQKHINEMRENLKILKENDDKMKIQKGGRRNIINNVKSIHSNLDKIIDRYTFNPVCHMIDLTEQYIISFNDLVNFKRSLLEFNDDIYIYDIKYFIPIVTNIFELIREYYNYLQIPRDVFNEDVYINLINSIGDNISMIDTIIYRVYNNLNVASEKFIKIDSVNDINDKFSKNIIEIQSNTSKIVNDKYKYLLDLVYLLSLMALFKFLIVENFKLSNKTSRKIDNTIIENKYGYDKKSIFENNEDKIIKLQNTVKNILECKKIKYNDQNIIMVINKQFDINIITNVKENDILKITIYCVNKIFKIFNDKKQ